LLVISPLLLLLLLHGWLLGRLSLLLHVPLPLLRPCSLLVLLLLPLLLLGGKRRRHVGGYRFGIQLPYELQDFLRAGSLARIIRKHICHTRKTNEKREQRFERREGAGPRESLQLSCHACMLACKNTHIHVYSNMHALQMK
jgi:hypothetical protein